MNSQTVLMLSFCLSLGPGCISAPTFHWEQISAEAPTLAEAEEWCQSWTELQILQADGMTSEERRQSTLGALSSGAARPRTTGPGETSELLANLGASLNNPEAREARRWAEIERRRRS